MTRYLIAGAYGMLGRDLQTALLGRDVTALGRNSLDITDLVAVLTAADGCDVIVNAAAYTRVDDAETQEDAAYAVNAVGARNLATAAARNSARLVQISTDYVFNGTATEPYPEDAPLDPISAYGRSKAAGERFVLAENPGASFIVRTAWLYGEHGPNFAKTMLRLAGSQPTVGVVNDQFGQPTWTTDLARQIVTLLDSDAPAGIYHGTSSGDTSWFEFARAVFDDAGLDSARVTPTDSSQFIRPAPRPTYSVLGHDAWRAAGLSPIRDWRDALAEASSQGVFDLA